MPVYGFECRKCGFRQEILKGADEPFNPAHCGESMDWIPYPLCGRFAWTPGKETGVYQYDHGIYATHDLTIPGKLDRLKREGRIVDPFDKR